MLGMSRAHVYNQPLQLIARVIIDQLVKVVNTPVHVHVRNCSVSIQKYYGIMSQVCGPKSRCMFKY